MASHSQRISRRSWLRRTIATTAVLAGGASHVHAAQRLDPQSPTAQALGYAADGTTAQRPSAEQRCAGCMHFGGGDDWGPCAIFQGQHVSPNGWCRAFTSR